MACALLASSAAGAGLQIVFGGFLKLLLEVRRGNAMFAPTLNLLIKTMENMKPSIERIEAFNRDFDRPEEIKGLEDLLRKGQDLVLKCSKVSRYNIVKKPYYSNKLIKFNEALQKYVSTNLQVHEAADIKETLFEVKMLSTKIRDLSMGTSSFGGSSKSVAVGVCSPPGLKVVPVGLEIPLKDMKEKLLNFDEVSKVIVVSAPGGCGKTTLAIALCQDANVHGIV